MRKLLGILALLVAVGAATEVLSDRRFLLPGNLENLIRRSALFGILSIYNMPMQLIPEVDIPTLTVETRWPGASPEEVEKQIVHEQELDRFERVLGHHMLLW